MNKKVLVFGGSGFLGSHVSDKLSDSGYNVTIFDRFESSYLKKNQKMVVGDILDKKKVLEVVKKNGSALQYADKSLKKDKEIAIQAVKNPFHTSHIHPFEFVDESLKKDPDILSIVNKKK